MWRGTNVHLPSWGGIVVSCQKRDWLYDMQRDIPHCMPCNNMTMTYYSCCNIPFIYTACTAEFGLQHPRNMINVTSFHTWRLHSSYCVQSSKQTLPLYVSLCLACPFHTSSYQLQAPYCSWISNVFKTTSLYITSFPSDTYSNQIYIIMKNICISN